MLVDFTVENYRSIKDPVTLSAVAQHPRQSIQSDKRRRGKADHEITSGHRVEEWDVELLPVLAIFGANASGKSNVIQALDYLLILMSHSRQGLSGFLSIFRYIEPAPFRLDKDWSKKPTRFELRTLFGNAIYTYSLTLTQNRILSESLEYTLSETKRSRRLFQRIWNEKTEKTMWKNGRDFAGSHTQLQKNVRDSEVFMSLLLQLEIEVIEPLQTWLKVRWHGVGLGHEEFDILSIMTIQEASLPTTSKINQEVLRMIKKFDTGISGISILKKEGDRFDFSIHALHETNDGSQIKWPFSEESLGTQRLFNLAYRIVLAFRAGGLTIVDELGTNIHPNIVRSIVKMFQNSKVNPRHAQLIFTSHDNTLQKNKLLRRDQIWFTQKRSDQSTELYPLTDFPVRTDLAVDKAYLDGRFGAVPFLPSEEEMILMGD